VAVLHPGKDVPRRGPVAGALVGDPHPRPVQATFVSLMYLAQRPPAYARTWVLRCVVQPHQIRISQTHSRQGLASLDTAVDHWYADVQAISASIR
jgi:hypothetical protein